MLIATLGRAGIIYPSSSEPRFTERLREPRVPMDQERMRTHNQTRARSTRYTQALGKCMRSALSTHMHPWSTHHTKA